MSPSLSSRVVMHRLNTSSLLYYIHHPSYMCKPQNHIRGRIHICNVWDNFPPKGKLPKLGTYLAYHQIISLLKQGAEHKTFFLNFEHFNCTDSYGNLQQKLLDNKWVSHGFCFTSEDRYVCKNIVCKELKDKKKKKVLG